MKYKLNDYNDINDPYVKELEELLPKTAAETMTYPQYCNVRDFFIRSLEQARMEERTRVNMIVYDKRKSINNKEIIEVLTDIISAI